MKVALVGLLFCLTSTIFAQDMGATYSIEEPIDVSGQYQPRTSAADRMRKIRAKLERKNEIMIKKKMEQIRFRQELKLMKQMQKKMNNISKQISAI